MARGKTHLGRKPWAAFVLTLALGACAGIGAQKTEVVEENVYPKNYRSVIVDQLRLQLTDAKGIRDAFLAEPILKPRGAITRYIACLRFNSKGGKGDYQGSKEYAAFFYSGGLTQITEAPEDLCKNSVYQPFPELERL
jgi:hypothetical protein